VGNFQVFCMVKRKKLSKKSPTVLCDQKKKTQ
jgi:hypothetical protein